MNLDPDSCDYNTDSENADHVDRTLWVPIITILCAMFSFFLEAFQIFETFRILNKLKDVFEKKKYLSDDVSEN